VAGSEGFGAFLWVRRASLSPLHRDLARQHPRQQPFRCFSPATATAAGLSSVLPYFLLFIQSWFYTHRRGAALFGDRRRLAVDVVDQHGMVFLLLAYPARVFGAAGAQAVDDGAHDRCLVRPVDRACVGPLRKVRHVGRLGGCAVAARWSPRTEPDGYVLALAALFIALCPHRRVRARVPGRGALSATFHAFRRRWRARRRSSASDAGVPERAGDHLFQL
jgi:hypothetical protein